MSTLVGHAFLVAGIGVSVTTALLWLRVALLGIPAAGARRATWATLGASAGACLTLEWALLRHDFAVRYVADNGGRHVPLYYTVTSLWAAQDGSLLLWLLVLTGYAALLARFAPSNQARSHPWAMSVVSAVSVLFFALVYFGADPFQAVSPVPADGPGPNPLLRDHPAMGLHPPLLYTGYVGMVVPFAYAVAGLVRGEAGGGWLEATRRWLLVSWSCLTAGIVLGAWWSYAVLGWGGYWAWDPVENASLLPWLTATALLHTALFRRRQARTGWTVSLACATFLLVLVGTYLTRSGAVASVHSFAQSPVGPILLGFVALLLVAVTILGVTRGPLLARAPLAAAAVSRESALLVNAVLLVSIAALVLTGTLFPLISQALTGTAAAAGPGYFNRTVLPLAVAILILMGVGPLLAWRRDTVRRALPRLLVPAAAGLASMAVAGLLARPGPLTLATLGAAAFALTASGRLAAARVREHLPRAVRAPGRRRLPALLSRRRSYGGLLAHAGIAVFATGVAVSSAFTVATEREVGAGQRITVGGMSAQLVRVDSANTSSGMTANALLRLYRDGRPAGSSRPGLRYYAAQDETVAVPSIQSHLSADVYATLTSVSDDGSRATVRLAVNPMIGLLWVGGAMTALGGLLAIGRRPARPGSERDRPASAAVPVEVVR